MQINSCLDACCAVAMAVVVGSFDEEAAGTLVADARHFAQTVGYQDFRNGNHKVPILFKGREVLEHGWEWGSSIAAEHEAISACASCNNADDQVCAVHG